MPDTYALVKKVKGFCWRWFACPIGACQARAHPRRASHSAFIVPGALVSCTLLVPRAQCVGTALCHHDRIYQGYQKVKSRDYFSVYLVSELLESRSKRGPTKISELLKFKRIYGK